MDVPNSLHYRVDISFAADRLILDHNKLPHGSQSSRVRRITSPVMNSLFLSRETDLVDSLASHTVLVVEDEMLVRMPIAEYLRDCGYNVVEAGDAREAIAAVDADGPVSLVFSDVRMPGTMDGFGLAEWFRLHHPDVPVLLTSGYHGGRTLSPATSRSGRLIEKPYSQTHVARRIAELLARRVA